MKTIANIRVGRAQTTHARPSHVPGVRMGNQTRDVSLEPTARAAQVNARRATGINARDREPIDPRMPKLFPA